MKVIQASLNNLNLSLITFKKQKQKKKQQLINICTKYCKLSKVIKIYDS